jgi:hypothetical protein
MRSGEDMQGRLITFVPIVIDLDEGNGTSATDALVTLVDDEPERVNR